MKEETNIRKIFEAYELDCSPTQESQFYSYMKRLLKYNESINLTAIKEEEEFILRHYVDSLSIIGLDQYNNAKRIIDVGTGGGFPGVPLAIMNPEKTFTLLDSLDKRLKIIDEICSEMRQESETISISNVCTLHQRAEDAGQDSNYREQFDLCVSRAVADLSVLTEYCLPFVGPGGYFIAYKSRNVEEELAGAKKSINTLGGDYSEISIADTITDQSLIIIPKKHPTPSKYPRRPGDPKRKPIK